MTNKWKIDDIEKISNGFVKKTIETVFLDKTKWSGDEIVTLTDFPQINYFILREIFIRWESDLEKFKSPYFNFEAPEVLKSFEGFKNTLSRNILVGKENLESLLATATTNTLELYLDPKVFFTKDFKNLPEFKLKAEWLQKNKVFFKSYSWLLDGLLEGVSEEPNQWVYANQAIDAAKLYLDDKQENHEDEVNKIALFADLKNEEASIEDNASFFAKLTSNEGKDVRNVTSLKVEESVSDFESPFDRIVGKVRNVVNKVSEPLENVEVVAPTLIETPKKEYLEAQTFVDEKKVEAKNENRTLNDSFLEAESKSLGDLQQRSHIESLKGSMSLNERFSYLNNLFNSELNEFDRALEEIEKSKTFEDAKQLVLQKYITKYNWDLKSDNYLDFVSLIKRRF